MSFKAHLLGLVSELGCAQQPALGLLALVLVIAIYRGLFGEASCGLLEARHRARFEDFLRSLAILDGILDGLDRCGERLSWRLRLVFALFAGV
jgi:hypothetical protein